MPEHAEPQVQPTNVTPLPIAPRREAYLRPYVIAHQGRQRTFHDTQDLYDALGEIDAAENAKYDAAERLAELAEAKRRDLEWDAMPWLARLPFLIAGAAPRHLILVAAGVLVGLLLVST